MIQLFQHRLFVVTHREVAPPVILGVAWSPGGRVATDTTPHCLVGSFRAEKGTVAPPKVWFSLSRLCTVWPIWIGNGNASIMYAAC